MSEFFRALQRADLERAERERGLRRPSIEGPGQAAPLEPAPAAAAATIEAAPVTAPSAAPAGAEVHEPARPSESRPRPGVRVSLAGGDAGEVDEHLVSLITPETFEADQYRVLRHTLEQRRRSAGLAIVAVSSAGPGAGKTTTAINLAGALAQDRSARVLLVDCDLRRPAMAGRLDLPDGRGLVQAIVDPLLGLDDIVHHLAHFNLDVVAAGFETAAPYELLKSPRLGELLDAARRRYEYVVVDTPPVAPFPDCRVLAKLVDGFLLVVLTHRTPRRVLDEALGVLPKEAVLAIVLNGEDQYLSRSYYGEDGGAPSDRWRASARRAWVRAWRDAAGAVLGGRDGRGRGSGADAADGA